MIREGRYKICASICNTDLLILKRSLKEASNSMADYIEIRFDYLVSFDLEELKEFIHPYLKRSIFTCRHIDEGGSFKGSEEERVKILLNLADLAPKYMDIELKTVRAEIEIVQKVRSRGSSVILSFHDFHDTPDPKQLRSLLAEMLPIGDIVKIVSRARRFEDNLKVLSLYRGIEEGRLIAFCMGELGVTSRVIAPLLGCPFMYASFGTVKAAPGQLSLEELREIYDLIEDKGRFKD